VAVVSRVLVTGGFGFLGSHVLADLVRDDAVEAIHVVDDLSTSAIPLETLLDELGRPGHLTHDLVTVHEYMSGAPDEFDLIVHLASVVGPAGVLRHGGRIVSSIVNDTYLLADYAIDRGARLLDVSTSEVYGGGRDGLCGEDDMKVVPPETTFRLEYAVGKLAAETALVNLHERYGLQAVIVRPFNIAGPRQSGEGGFVLPRFLAQARLGLPLTVFGDGSARRAFSHVEDLADGVLLVARAGTPGTAYNLGNHENIVTVDRLADIVLEVTGSRSEKVYVDPRTLYGPAFVEANDKFPAPGRAVEELGWEPSRSIEQIVADTWEYMSAADSTTFLRLAGTKVVEQMLEAQVAGVAGVA
jgi:nucleoside-diphosphate-sugar epimerase